MNRALRFPAISLISAALALSAAAQQTTPPPTTPPPAAPAPADYLPDAPGTQVKAPVLPTGPTAVLDTSMGRITCKLDAKEAPKTVANFV